MLKYKRIFSDGNISRYEYYPEGRGDAGIVEFSNGEYVIIKHSSDDFKSFYAMHAVQIDCSSEEGTIAWY